MTVQLEKDQTGMVCLEGLQEKASPFIKKDMAAQIRIAKLHL